MTDLTIERIALIKVFLLRPDVPAILRTLSQKGFTTARVIPRFDGYEIAFLDKIPRNPQATVF